MNDKTLAQRSKELDKKMQGNPIDEAIAVLVKDARRRKKQILALTISLILDVVLTVGLAVLSIQASQTAADVQHSKAVLVSNCKVGNEFRATEAGLWEHILSLQPTSTNYTPEQQAQRDKTVAEFRDYLKTTFAPRDCDNIIEK